MKTFLAVGTALCAVVVVLHFGTISGFAQTGQYLYTGSETSIALNPGTYDITAYGAPGGWGDGTGGGGGAEMEGQFSFSGLTTLTILVGGNGVNGYYAGGGGGGSFVVEGSTPLVIAGGGGGGGYSGGGGGNGNSGSNGGGGGGSVIDSSAIMVVAEVSGIASGNGEIIITAVPEPATWAMVALGIGTVLGSLQLRLRSA
jgi:hypothetical protein